MTKILGLFISYTRTLTFVSALVMAVALPMWSSSAVAQDNVKTSEEDGGDTFVKRTYDNKTGKLLEIVRNSEVIDPNDKTKILKKIVTKKYDQGKRPPYQTSVDEQEIVYDGQKRVLRKQAKTLKVYGKNKSGDREVETEIEEKRELVALDANGKPIYSGTRTTSRAHNIIPEKYEVLDAGTNKWMYAGSTYDKLLAAKKEQLLNAQRLKKLNRPENTAKNPSLSPDDIISHPTKNKGMHYLVDDELNRTEIIKDAPEKPAEGQIIDTEGSGVMTGKDVRLFHLNGCGTTINGVSHGESTGKISTPCPGLVGGLVATRADYIAHCMRWGDPKRNCPPLPGSSIKYLEKITGSGTPITTTGSVSNGIDGTPLEMFCHLLQAKLLTTNDSELIKKSIVTSTLLPIFKYDNKDQNLECFYLSMEQAKSLYAEFKNPIKKSVASKPETKRKPQTSANSTDKNTGITTTSVRNPDGTRTVAKTDRDGNILSTESVGKSPASASSTDKNTGITTTSVRNPDGTRTVTETDKDGTILSREKLR